MSLLIHIKYVDFNPGRVLFFHYKNAKFYGLQFFPKLIRFCCILQMQRATLCLHSLSVWGFQTSIRDSGVTMSAID